MFTSRNHSVLDFTRVIPYSWMADGCEVIAAKLVVRRATTRYRDNDFWVLLAAVERKGLGRKFNCFIVVLLT